MAKKSRSRTARIIRWLVTLLVIAVSGIALFTVAFDEAVLVRKGTFYRLHEHEKLVALTFDDGPSPQWTPQILDQLRKEGVKATFFMLGAHAEKYPEVARMVAADGHEIGNHTYSHRVILYYTMAELEDEIKRAEASIKTATGQTTRLFRPPKAWVTDREKIKIKEMGYETVLWSLNSKDWVTFDDKLIVPFLAKRVTPGDIILFHDSGGVFGSEGGDRHQTVQAMPRLIKRLKSEGYRFVTVSELIERSDK